MREIGSEFWDVPTSGKTNTLFPESTQWYLSGRSALQAIIRELHGARSVSIPSWCCDSIIKPFVDAGMEICFYPVWSNGVFHQQVDLNSDVLLIMDFFGYTGEQPDLSGYKGIVIRDVTHSLFSSTYCDASYYFGSLRKWCGIWTGGYGWASNGHQLTVESTSDCSYVALRQKAMHLKNRFINQIPDADGKLTMDKSYLSLYNEAEEKLDDVGIAPADEIDIERALHLDVEFIKSMRRANAEVLRQAFSDLLIFPKLKDTDCPMFVPIVVPDRKRDDLRRYLIQNEIYCPIHWPMSSYHKLSEEENSLYDNELSLVCDQRYAEEDMNRMVDEISRFWKEA